MLEEIICGYYYPVHARRQVIGYLHLNSIGTLLQGYLLLNLQASQWIKYLDPGICRGLSDYLNRHLIGYRIGIQADTGFVGSEVFGGSCKVLCHKYIVADAGNRGIAANDVC